MATAKINTWVFLVTGVALALARGSIVATLAVLALSTVILIVFGERFAWETKLEHYGIPSREAWVPSVAMAIALATHATSFARIGSVFLDKVSVILLIFTFALVSFGIGKSGFFEYAAFHATKWAHGNTSKLIIAVYILASALAYVTSNDIVILVLTPIVFAIAVYGRVRNAKLLLLAQFMAANTLAMGSIIGSPTNIIVAEKLNIAFLAYLMLMLVPLIVAFGTSLGMVYLIDLWARKHGSLPHRLGWACDDGYNHGNIALQSSFTGDMAGWIGLFGAVVVLTALVTQWHAPLLIVPVFGVPAFIIRLAFAHRGDVRKVCADTIAALHGLPYGILFFGMCFFVFAAEIAQSGFVGSVVVPFIEKLLTHSIFGIELFGVFASGLLVNTMNDLPSSALISEILTKVHTHGTLGYWALVQSAMVGVNIGCYLTPIGALAGIVWFNILRSERARQKKLKEAAEARGEKFSGDVTILTPSRLDLVLYGMIQFVPVAITTSIASALTLTLWWHFFG